MEFIIKNTQKSISDIMRQIGYMPAYFQKDGEFSMVRKIARNDYPRFHLYIKEVVSPVVRTTGLSYNFSLHLDQKKPSYFAYRSLGEGGLKAHAHSGEYDGDVVEGEAERIRQILDL